MKPPEITEDQMQEALNLAETTINDMGRYTSIDDAQLLASALLHAYGQRGRIECCPTCNFSCNVPNCPLRGGRDD